MESYIMANELDVLGWGGGMEDDIVGEQTRGGGSSYTTPVYGEDILGAVFNAAQNPAFRAQLAANAARARPVIRSQPPVKARDWAMPFTAYGTIGQSVTVTASPQCLFRAEKLIVTEIGASTNGYGTKITAMSVGQKNQLPVTTGGMLSASFVNLVLGNGIRFDTCQPALTISFTVSFLQTCTWEGTLFGKAVVA